MRAFFWQESLVGGGSSDLPRSFLQIISFLRGHERPITRSYTLGAMWEILTNAHTSHQHCGLTWTLWGGLEGVYYSRPPPILFIKREAKMPKSTQAMPCHHLKRFLRLSPPSLVRKCTPQKCLPPRAPLFYPTCTPLLYVLPPRPPPLPLKITPLPRMNVMATVQWRCHFVGTVWSVCDLNSQWVVSSSDTTTFPTWL
jgi:hypothetical protein